VRVNVEVLQDKAKIEGKDKGEWANICHFTGFITDTF